ncbi:MAG: hypothetical protein Kow0077_12970 [Anaerolineae bacterium]
MRRWILIILVAGLVLTGAGKMARAQDGGEEALPPCTAEDLAPLREIVTGMVETMDREGGLGVANLLRWREAVAGLTLTECAGMKDALVQLQLASDELLIGALLLDRTPADEAEAEQLARVAAVAINTGLTNLVGMRFAFAGGADEPAGESFGSLSGADVLAAFQTAGLPMADVNPAAGPAGGGAPTTEAERITFTLPEARDGAVGQVLVFRAARDRDAWLAYLFGEVPDPGYVYAYANVIVQLSPELPRQDALRFRAALRGLGG